MIHFCNRVKCKFLYPCRFRGRGPGIGNVVVCVWNIHMFQTEIPGTNGLQVEGLHNAGPDRNSGYGAECHSVIADLKGVGTFRGIGMSFRACLTVEHSDCSHSNGLWETILYPGISFRFSFKRVAIREVPVCKHFNGEISTAAGN